MAHKSKKKHIKHLHQHELSSSPPTAKKRPGTKADVEVASVRSAPAKATGKRGGIVRSIARAATKKIAAKPKKIIKRATKRVKSLLAR